MFAKQGKHIIYLIHSQGPLTLFEVSYKPQTYTCTLSQFYLRKTVFLSFLLDVFR